MWIFCKHGFFSAVQDKSDRRMIHLRARFKGDLEHFAWDNGFVPRVSVTPDADYRYRMTVPRARFERAVAKEAREIDYTNFKASCPGSPIFHSTLMRVWNDLRIGQDEAARSEWSPDPERTPMQPRRTDAAGGGKRKCLRLTTPRRVSSSNRQPEAGR